MTYGMADVVAALGLIEGGDTPERQRRIERQKLNALLGYCESARCRRQVLLGYFGEREHAPCGNCDTCLDRVETWDGTVAAQKAISAVYRTGQRFGVGHLIDVLLGNATERITALGHDRLPTFGVGSELDKSEWQSVFRQLVAAGHLELDPEGYGGLRIGESARTVLRGEAVVELRKDPAQKHRVRARRAGASPTLVSAAEAQVWERLRALRLELAREQGVPPYVIFHDATLLDMLRQRPRDLRSMASIPGVGRSKLERYGTQFLDALAGAGAT
jgi:ATP-dependent DNA helicase RecQ